MNWNNSETETVARAMDREKSLPSVIRLVGAKNRWYMIVKTAVDAVGEAEAAEELLAPIRSAYEAELRYMQKNPEILEAGEDRLPAVDPGHVDWSQLTSWLVSQFVEENKND